MGNIENVRPAVRFPRRGDSPRGRGNRGGHSRRPWQPAGRSRSAWQQRVYLPPDPDLQAPSCYLTFISRAVLWDKGVYHCMGLTHRDFLPTLCPRFMGHMKVSPADLRPPRVLSSQPRPGARWWGNGSGRRLLVPQNIQSGGGAGRSLQYMGQTTRRRCAVVYAPTPPSPPPSRELSSSCCPSRTPPRHPETDHSRVERTHCRTSSPPLSLALGSEEESAEGEKAEERQVVVDKEAVGDLDLDPLLSAAQSPSLSPNPSPDPELKEPDLLSEGEGELGFDTPAGSFSRSDSLSDFSRPPSSQFSRSTDLCSRQSSRGSSGSVIQSDDEDHQSNSCDGNTADANVDDDDDDGYLNHQGQQIPSQRPPSRLPPLPVPPHSLTPPTESKSSQQLEPTRSSTTSDTRSDYPVGVIKVLKENVDDPTQNQIANLTPHPSLGSVSLATWRTSSRCLSGRISESGASIPTGAQSEWTSQRWSRLPPIMPSQGVSGSVASGCSHVIAVEDEDEEDEEEDDDDDDDDEVFAELDAVAPRTGSCQLTDHPLSSDPGTSPTSPETALSPGLAALTVGCASGGLGSFSRVHLLMLDRPDQELEPYSSPLDLEWNTPTPPPPDGATTSWSDFRGEDYQQTGASCSVSENSVLLEGHAAHSMTYSERGSPSPSSWLLRTSFSDISVGSHPGEDGEDLERISYTDVTPVTRPEHSTESSPQLGESGREDDSDEDPAGRGGKGEEEEEEEEQV
ncbi:uncharacterized protein LOC134061698 [Sardina pilchardus]|uniref:uncharacterized protein LOC134061698 n=1 Tax=Sardina pilchardus TaxID=27697 RepID=UPI002E113495